MARHRRMRVALGFAAGLAVGAGVMIAAWSRPMPVPLLTAVATPLTRVTGSPCTTTARACVDLTTRHAWLIRDGRIVLGPVPVNIGGPGELTPMGTFRVWRKDPHHVSVQQHGTPMPYSVFFDRGVAFHSGPLALMSAGCVHLRPNDAIAFYNNLRIGDQVQVRATRLRPLSVPAGPGHPSARAGSAAAPVHPGSTPAPARTRTTQPAGHALPRTPPPAGHAFAPTAQPAGRPLPRTDPGVHVLPPTATTPPRGAAVTGDGAARSG